MTADPLIELAERIERETGKPVPAPNPSGPTTSALVLFLLRDPGATPTSGANETGYLDPYLNRDPTSARQRSALRRAGLDPAVCVWWNASPYHLGYKGTLRPSDLERGSHYLLQFMALCPRLRVVVAMGAGAQEVAAKAWAGRHDLPRLTPAPHPMIYGRGAAERQTELDRALRHVVQLLAV